MDNQPKYNMKLVDFVTASPSLPYAGGKDTERVEDWPDSADMEEERGMCVPQESTGASHYSAKY